MTATRQMLTVDAVKRGVDEVGRLAPDDEAAHVAEDALYGNVLRAIADGICEDARECARVALKAQEIKFARWCA